MIEAILGAVIIAQMGIIYGLVQRLLGNAGVTRLHPTEAIPEALREGQVSGGTVDPTPRQVARSFRIGL